MQEIHFGLVRMSYRHGHNEYVIASRQKYKRTESEKGKSKILLSQTPVNCGKNRFRFRMWKTENGKRKDGKNPFRKQSI